jgi:uncharacterized SAM-binding protein YcdF (DUF218 family)
LASGDELTGDQTRAHRPRRRRRVWVAGAAVLLLALAAVIFFRGAGRWLIVADPLERSDAIVVLSGGLPYRAIEAAKIYRQGMAPQVWLTRAPNPSAVLNEMGISFASEETYNHEILVHQGVPEAAIQTLPPEIVNTAEEERAIIQQMQSARLHRVIIVTSPPHTRRVRALWRRLAPAGLALIVRPAGGDEFDADHWWRTTTDALSVVREILGLLNAWAGLPIRPAAH